MIKFQKNKIKQEFKNLIRDIFHNNGVLGFKTLTRNIYFMNSTL